MSTNDRDNQVRAVLATAEKPLGPTEIARRVGQAWCGGLPGDYGLSSAVVPVLRRIGATRVGTGQYILKTDAEEEAISATGVASKTLTSETN